ncbi:EamA family transporter [Deltaproteobacteria bacterium Smac51]|nr:EamA family transporter [Deltaproteobacteria bacterium Smac51]
MYCLPRKLLTLPFLLGILPVVYTDGGITLKPEIFFTGKKAVTILALTTCFLWGSAYPAIKYGYKLFNIASGNIPAQLIFAGYRFALAGALVLIFASVIGQKIMVAGARNWGRMVILGLGMTTIQYTFFYVGLGNTTGVKASILNPASTFFSVILAHFLCAGDRLNRYTVAGCLIGFIGVFVVNWGGGSMDWNFHFNGEGFLILACLCMAGAGIYGKAVSQTVNPVVMTGWQLFIGGLVLTLIGYGAGGRLTGFTVAGSVLLGYMALLSSSAFALYSILMKYNPVSRITIFTFSIPLFGACLSAIFLGEHLLEWKNLAALLLVSSGIWLVTSRNK